MRTSGRPDATYTVKILVEAIVKFTRIRCCQDRSTCGYVSTVWPECGSEVGLPEDGFGLSFRVPEAWLARPPRCALQRQLAFSKLANRSGAFLPRLLLCQARGYSWQTFLTMAYRWTTANASFSQHRVWAQVGAPYS